MSEIDHGERGHSPIGASSAYRWMSCPASVRLSKGLESKSSSYAEDGTISHELCEYCIEEGLDPIKLIGDEFKGIIIDRERAEAVKVYVDYIRKESEGKELEIESQICISRIDSMLYGSVDAVIIDPFVSIEVIDFKYGAGLKVSPDNNKQLMFYALGCWDGECEEVKLTIVQPRRVDEDGSSIRTWKTTGDRLRKFEEELKAAVAATRNPKAKTCAGEHCRFCLAAPHCPGLRDQALEVAQTVFDDVTEVELPSPEKLSNKQLTKALQGAKLLSTWIKSVEAYAEQQLNKGVEVEGYKLVKKRAIRKWKDEINGQLGDLEEMFGEDIYEPKKLKSPAKLEKLIGKQNVSEYTYKPETGTTVVPASDKRPAVTAEVISVFTNID